VRLRDLRPRSSVDLGLDEEATRDGRALGEGRAVTDPGRIVVGVDGSAISGEALAWAVQQAALTHATLELVTAWHFPVSYGFPVVPAMDSETGARAEQDNAVEHAGIALPQGTLRTVTQGHPVPVLREASQGAQLLVVGSRGHGGFSGLVLGSVSEHVIAYRQATNPAPARSAPTAHQSEPQCVTSPENQPSTAPQCHARGPGVRAYE
jgi:nucleotide-binding universal stress UspA family protein